MAVGEYSLAALSLGKGVIRGKTLGCPSKKRAIESASAGRWFESPHLHHSSQMDFSLLASVLSDATNGRPTYIKSEGCPVVPQRELSLAAGLFGAVISLHVSRSHILKSLSFNSTVFSRGLKFNLKAFRHVRNAIKEKIEVFLAQI